MTAGTLQQTVRIANGTIYLDASVCDKYFRGLDTVAILVDYSDLLIFPIRQTGGGGLLMKIRNAHGDRVIHAHEVLSANGYDDTGDVVLSARWDSGAAALRLIP